MITKNIELFMSIEDFDEIDLEQYAVNIAELVANGATSGKSLDGKVGWKIYNSYSGEENNY